MRIIRLAWPLDIPNNTQDDVFLDQDQARHGALSLRLKPGAKVEMIGTAGLAPAQVSAVELSGRFSKKNPGLAVRLNGPWVEGNSTGPRLAMALIQGQRFDLLVEKSVELGATQLIPILCERCKAQDAKPGSGKQERWRRIAEEARKQCGRAKQMDIFPPHLLKDLIKHPGPAYFLSPKSFNNFSHEGGPIFHPSPLLIIGPEGGFSETEEKFLNEAAFTPLNLGKTILRAETAALAALALLMK